MTIPELLAPAGSLEALDAAVGEGADAVYLGLKEFNARMRSANFTYSQFEGALRSLRRMGRRLYVTVNTVFEQREADRVYQLLKYLAGLGPDGIIVQDFGIITMVRDNFPSLKLHASTQMNVASARGVNLLSRHGFSRVVLARELSLSEIQDIRSNTNMELEVFVHGALCMSVSGLCLFSSYLGGKSANRGMCTQACRRFYTADADEGFDDSGKDGGYYFSPADLELIEKVPALADAGVNSFKIEGRMKSAEYVGAVVSAYRLVLDNLDGEEKNQKRAIADARAILKNDFARSKTFYLVNENTGIDWLNPKQNGGTGIPGNTGIDWLNPKQNGGTGIPGNTGIDWLNPKQNGGTGIPLGKLIKVKGRDEESRGLVQAGAIAPSVGDSIRLHKANDSDRVSHKIFFAEEGPNNGRWISIPKGFSPGDAVYLIQTKAMTKRYAPVVRRNAVEKSRGPGRDRAPLPRMESLSKTESAKTESTRIKVKKSGNKRGAQEDFPGGFYAMVSRVEDLYILQSSRPVKAILPYNRKTAKVLLDNNKQCLPFPARDIILSLDPFFSQAKEKELCEEIPLLMEMGYTRFIVNNLGHFSLFRASGSGEKAVLVAGPWLYTFNAWAGDFIARNGAGYFISPLENNRQNLEKTFPAEERNLLRRRQVFITIFSRPSLFRIRQDLSSLYRFNYFSGRRIDAGQKTEGGGESFRLNCAPEGSIVYPWEPFSIVDKTPFLKEAGFTRFILDFSSSPLKKADYRDIMEAVKRAAPLPGTSRFNWKNGFFRNEE